MEYTVNYLIRPIKYLQWACPKFFENRMAEFSNRNNVVVGRYITVDKVGPLDVFIMEVNFHIKVRTFPEC